MDSNVDSTKRQLDTIMYMASLASRPKEIDPILDTVRAVTASLPPGGQLTPAQQQSLKEVERRLAIYLTRDEPLRVFTLATLQERIEARFAKGASLRSLRAMLAVILLATAAIGAVLLVLPLDLPRQTRFQMVGSTVFGILPAGAAIFFYTALKTFKPALQKAYRLICLGMLIFGVSLLDQPILDYYHVRESPYGAFAIAIPMLVAFGMIYQGVRQYAQVAGLRGRLFQLRTLLWVLAVASAVAIILPHATILNFSEIFFDISAILLVALGMVGIMTGLMLFSLARTGARIYSAPQRTLGVALMLAGSGALYILALRYAVGMTRPEGLFLISVLAFIIAGSLFLRAGYIFNRAGRY